MVPQHFRAEAMNAVRGRWLRQAVSADQFDEVVRELIAADLDVWPTEPLLPRMRELASNATSYDAAFVALAEELDCALVTSDTKFAGIPGIRCRVIGYE